MRLDIDSHQPKRMASTADSDAGPSVPALPSEPLLNHALRMRLAAIDGEMAELQASLDSARIPIVEALGSLVYPILALPPEITAEIFLQYVAEHPLRLPRSYTNLSGPPLLASICRAWRHIALNLQVIWSNITVDLIATEPLLQCCLARAGGSLLTLDMDLRGESPERLFNAAAQYCMQWETFRTYLNFPLAFPMNQVEGRILRLRKLVLIAFYDAQNDIGTTTPITAFCEAPQLREVYLDEVSLPSIALPWAQFTDITCGRIDAAQIGEMLLETRHLEKLALRWPRDPFSDAILVPLPLPSIRALAITDDSALDFLERVTLPTLEILEIRSGSPSRLPQVLRLFARSRCRLHSISMSDAGHFFSLPILEAMPTTSELDLFMNINSGWSGERDLIPFLKRLATDMEFLPNLQMLSMKWDIRRVPQGLVEILHELVEMLESRRYQRTNDSKKMLESFTLKWHPNENEKREWNLDLLRRLRVLMADGLELDIPGIEKLRFLIIVD
ncbi:hypothetical protein B0H19DRAFT_1232159 [Mycena capillaripes]|nr:hypothetical protein B0H19DRAFT_1232159 [Mycena capillaripes]